MKEYLILYLGKHHVFFYGTYENALLKKEDLFDFSDNQRTLIPKYSKKKDWWKVGIVLHIYFTFKTNHDNIPYIISLLCVNMYQIYVLHCVGFILKF